MAQLAFYLDQNLCMSCSTCTVACKDWNQVQPGPVAWRTQFTYEMNGEFHPLSMGCNHCSEPACIKACAIGAITKDPETGIVSVDRGLCQNFRGCVEACPYGKTLFADDDQESIELQKKYGWSIPHPMQKCDMCYNRVTSGQKPACVGSCVGRALDWGTVEKIMKDHPDAVRLNPSDFPYAYKNNNNDTQPNFFISKKKTQPIIEDYASGYEG